jgi:hypothetical protein
MTWRVVAYLHHVPPHPLRLVLHRGGKRKLRLVAEVLPDADEVGVLGAVVVSTWSLLIRRL